MMRLGPLLLALVAACAPAPPSPQERETTGPNPSAISPNASILPAPLASAPPTAPSPSARPAPRASAPSRPPTPVLSAEGARSVALPVELPPAEPIRADGVIPVDPISSRESTGLLLVGEWRMNDLSPPPKVPEVSLEGIAIGRRLTSLRWLIAIAEAGRLRVSFDSRAFPVPPGSELRARADQLGHALVFPGGHEYRPAPPGSLRALFGDRRLDVLPLLPGEASPRGAAPARLGLTPRRWELSSPLGNLLLDLALLPEPNLGAALLCRLLLELVAIDPSWSLCAPGLLPVRAQFAWRSGGGILFELSERSRRMELPVSDLACPPLGARVAGAMVPGQGGVFLGREEQGAFRQRPGEVTGGAGAGAPAEGLVVKNQEDGLRYVVVDGVAVAWVMPGGEATLAGFPRGRYAVQGRSFLGDVQGPVRVLEAPGWVTLGNAPPEAVPASSR